MNQQSLSFQSVQLPAEPGSIGLIHVGGLGDLVRSLCVLPALSNRFPDVAITFICEASLQAVVADHPDVSRCVGIAVGDHTDSDAFNAQVSASLSSLPSFDLLLNLDDSVASAWVTAFTSAESVIGNSFDASGLPVISGSVYTLLDAMDPALFYQYLPQFSYSYERRLCARMGVSDHLAVSQIALTSLLPQRERLLAALGYEQDIPLVGLQIDSHRQTDHWEASDFIDLARLLVKAGVQVVLFSGSEKTEHYQALTTDLDFPVLKGQGLRFSEWLVCLPQCELVVTNDSSPMQVAAALDCQCLVLFGQTSMIARLPDRMDVLGVQASGPDAFSVAESTDSVRGKPPVGGVFQIAMSMLKGLALQPVPGLALMGKTPGDEYCPDANRFHRLSDDLHRFLLLLWCEFKEEHTVDPRFLNNRFWQFIQELMPCYHLKNEALIRNLEMDLLDLLMYQKTLELNAVNPLISGINRLNRLILGEHDVSLQNKQDFKQLSNSIYLLFQTLLTPDTMMEASHLPSV